MAKEFKIHIADQVIQVSPLSPKIEKLCWRYLLEDESKRVDFCAHMTETQLWAERDHWSEEEQKMPENAAMLSQESLEYIALYRSIAEQMLAYDTWLMHGSVIAVDGEAYMFTAPSGTGKSTHSYLWRKAFGERAVMVNDDKPLLRLDGDRVLACGTPWNGKHDLGENIQVPLKGICFLSRAEENRIERLSVEDAFPLIYQQTYRPDDAEKLMKTLDLVDVLLKRVPVYQLQMNNYKDDAVAVCYNGMYGAEKTEHEE